MNIWRRTFLKGSAAWLSSFSLRGRRLAAAMPAAQMLTLRTRSSTFRIGATGALVAIRSSNDINYLAPGEPAPLLSLRIAGKLHPPSRATWHTVQKTTKTTAHTLTLHYDEIAATATLVLQAKPTHVTLALTDVQTTQPVELVLWGPYPTRIGDLVGEVVGVVRDNEFALGIQPLNLKTLGGYPSQENDTEPEGVVRDDTGIYPGLPDGLRKQQRWLGDTASLTSFGSTLQAYCRNRSELRSISNWDNANFPALPFDDGGAVGSRIALFAVPSDVALATLGHIEVAEGLPHPMLHGAWAKLAPSATASYLIADFSESTIDEAIAMTQRSGLKYLYHSSPFATWGHFQLKPALFPNGWDGFRACVARARKAGIAVGFHTLSNFITPNDPYVTPKPDPRLARTGSSQLASKVDATQTELPVADPKHFQKQTAMNTVTIGEELIRYERVSAEAPWRLLQCQRGAWGTTAAPHETGATVSKLMDHDYKVFLTDASLGQEVARAIAAFCNHTEAKQLSFDGLEGNWSTGLGQYGCALFTQAWYDALKPELRGCIINDASNAHPYTWHIATRYNWGEPWYAGFRQSQTLYRLKNQLYFTRNLMPRMLGWFALRKETSIEDVEWLCARAAGYDAGFALATSFESQARQGSAANVTGKKEVYEALEVVRAWETARHTDAFPETVKADLRDVDQEFRLTTLGPGEWELRRLKPAAAPVLLHADATRLRLWTNYNAGAIETSPLQM